MGTRVILATTFLGVAATLLHGVPQDHGKTGTRPSFLIILTDDQRADAMGCSGNRHIQTPHIDSLARTGVRFTNTFVTTSICCPSRAALLTGRYGSANGVTSLARTTLHAGEITWPEALRLAGYHTAMIGKWHLTNTPASLGFEDVVAFRANGPYYGREVEERGVARTIEGHIDEYVADQVVACLERASAANASFAVWMCPQVPHMDDQFRWNARSETRQRYTADNLPVPASWDDDLTGKPAYLRTGRHRTRAIEEYGYDRREAVQGHLRDYYAAITDLDASLGRVLRALRELQLEDRTCVIFTSDNGWFMGEHRFTSKVLAYEESIRVPLIISGPGIGPATDARLVRNIDIVPTLLDLAGLPIPEQMQGSSLAPLLKDGKGRRDVSWHNLVLYEAMDPALGSWPILALRTERWKYILTFKPGTQPPEPVFEELYDLEADAAEMNNLAADPGHVAILENLRSELVRRRPEVTGAGLWPPHGQIRPDFPGPPEHRAVK